MRRSSSSLLVLSAALLFSTGGAAIKATTLSSWQVAGFRSGIAAVALLLSALGWACAEVETTDDDGGVDTGLTGRVMGPGGPARDANPFGPPPIYTGGFGPLMTEIAGEVADGFFVHPFNTRESMLKNTLPALEKGLAKAGRSRATLDIICATLTVTADREEDFERVKLAARKQLAFYGSTPAYRPTLDCHGWGDLHLELNRLSKQGKWDDMTHLIDDDVLAAIAVVGPRSEIAAKLEARLEGIADGVSLTHNRAPDPSQWADVVAALRD